MKKIIFVIFSFCFIFSVSIKPAEATHQEDLLEKNVSGQVAQFDDQIKTIEATTVTREEITGHIYNLFKGFEFRFGITGVLQGGLNNRENRLILMSLGGDIELDRTVLDEIGDPLIHLIRNAVDHGIEVPSVREKAGKKAAGRITLSASREKSHVLIEVIDDGKGMGTEEIKKSALKKGIVTDDEVSSMTREDLLLLTMRPGFSTNDEITDVSGRGVGLDVVKEKAEALGGSVSITSSSGKGSKISMRLPVTTAVVQALLIDVYGRKFAVPISSIVEIIVVNESDVKRIENSETILHRNSVLPIIRLGKLFGGAGKLGPEAMASNDPESFNVVILEHGIKQFGVVVNKLISQQDIVIKQLTRETKGVRGFAGATILGNGSVALVLDVATLV